MMPLPTSVLDLQFFALSLLTIEIVYVAGQQSDACSTGLNTSLTNSNVSRNNWQSIFPSINFTCYGNITWWRFYARYNDTAETYSLYPEFQIWRRGEGSDSRYIKVSHTNITSDSDLDGPFRRGALDWYIYNTKLSDHLSFQPGDILGIHTPSITSNSSPRSRLRFRFNRVANGASGYFKRETEPLSMFDVNATGVSINTRHIPILSVQIAIFQTTSMGTSTTVIRKTSTVSVPAQPSNSKRLAITKIHLPSSSQAQGSRGTAQSSLPPMGTQSPTDGTRTSGSVLSTAVAAGVCVAVVLVVVTLLVIALVVCLRKMRKKSMYDVTSTTTTTLDNPTYDTNEYHMYNDNPVNGHANHSLEISVGHYDYASEVKPVISEDSVYADPKFEESCLDNVYESTDLQCGLYVPTLEQRTTEAVKTQTDTSADIYSAVYSTLRAMEANPVSEVFFEERDIYWAPSSNPEKLYSQLSTHKYREIIRQQIQITTKIGSGEFGTVHQGVWNSPRGPIDVAIKTLNEGTKEKNKVKFLQEAAINGQFHHPSIIKLEGVVTVGEPVMIVLDLMPHGDLRNYLIGLRPSPGELAPPELPKECLQFCRQVCSGMEYLYSKSFVHRDLAARNILVSREKTCKIADFGMARDIEESEYYVSHGGMVPVKWTAPEALNYKKYSSASDAWSFGALMYEIWSLGHKPFEKYRNTEVMKLVNEGFRLPPPPGCPKEIYTLMIKCWHPEASSRPTFTDLMTSLSQPDSKMLRCPRDTATDPPEGAAMLGAPLEMGEKLYPQLQSFYKDI